MRSRKHTALMIILAMLLIMGTFPTAGMAYAAEDQTAEQEMNIEAAPAEENKETAEEVTAQSEEPAEQPQQEAKEEQQDSQQEEPAEEISEAPEAEEPAEEQAAEKGNFSLMAEEADEELPAEEGTTGDFIVTASADAEYSFADGVLTITKGNVTVKTEGETSHRIEVAESAALTLDGVTINASGGPAIKAAPGASVKLTLKDGSTNNVTGASGFAGVESGWEDGNMATLTIKGSGKLDATGGDKSAGIGGSYNNNGISSYSGNIIIESGNIKALGTNGGAGIGSANNNGKNADGSSQSASYKMQAGQIGSITIKGGTIDAEGRAGAGIGGGNHCDSGKITIEGGNINAKSNDGAGIGCGRGSSNYGGDANKGHGYFYADVTIKGGTIDAEGGWLSAGIGGGYECDAIIKISGGTIAKATGGNGNNGSYYQGAPGIGAGYQGNVSLEMTGGTVKYAEGGWSAPGIGYGAAIQDYGKKRKADGENVSSENSIIKISGGTIEMAKGGKFAAGIGAGNGCSICNIEISGGSITAMGYSDKDDLTAGGAGIGSGAGAASGLKYSQDTALNISITGGSINATGGWGASGIGSGASNISAKAIDIDGSKADVKAFADGTKFAIDTRESGGSNTTVSGDILQGTFVHKYEKDGISQDTESLEHLKVINDETGEEIPLTKPVGYRSFATTVDAQGAYTIYSHDEQIAEGNGCYYNVCTSEDYDENNVTERNVKYTVTNGQLSDNHFLFPVKTVVVSKKVLTEGAAKAENIDGTLYFALWAGGENGAYVQKDGKTWTEAIDVIDGAPQGNAYFANVDDGEYGIWELDENGEVISAGSAVDGTDMIIKSVDTKHGDSDDNDAVIGDLWSEEITVVNTYYEKAEEPEDPAEPADPAPVDPADPADPAPVDPEDTEDPAGPQGPATVEPQAPAPAQAQAAGNAPLQAVNPANPGTFITAETPQPYVGGAFGDILVDDENVTIGDDQVPLGHDEHKDNIILFLLALATIMTLALYSMRRKNLKKDIYELEEELAKHGEVR